MSDAWRAGRSACAAARSEVGPSRTKLIVTFCSGAHAQRVLEVANAVREIAPEATLVVAAADRVLAAQAELEGLNAVVSMALDSPVELATPQANETGPERGPGGHAHASQLGSGVSALDSTLGHEVGTRLARSGRGRSLVVLGESASFQERWLLDIQRASGANTLVGGGCLPGASLAVGLPYKAPRTVPLLAFELLGPLRLALGVSTAAQPLHAPLEVTGLDGHRITQLGARPPLEVLTEVMHEHARQAEVLVSIERSDHKKSMGRPTRLIRPIAGVDAASHSIYVQAPLEVGDRVAFAIRDRTAARQDLEAMLRDLKRQLAGGAPMAALCFSCTARGHSLFGAHNVEARAIRNLLPVPMCGLHTSFELAPYGEKAQVHMHSLLLAVLYAPS